MYHEVAQSMWEHDKGHYEEMIIKKTKSGMKKHGGTILRAIEGI
jgi:hypothetical protein